jgi:hypothetical protein
LPPRARYEQFNFRVVIEKLPTLGEHVSEPQDRFAVADGTGRRDQGKHVCRASVVKYKIVKGDKVIRLRFEQLANRVILVHRFE